MGGDASSPRALSHLEPEGGISGLPVEQRSHPSPPPQMHLPFTTELAAFLGGDVACILAVCTAARACGHSMALPGGRCVDVLTALGRVSQP